MSPRLGSNFQQSSCLGLPRVVITGVCPHTSLGVILDPNPNRHAEDGRRFLTKPARWERINRLEIRTNKYPVISIKASTKTKNFREKKVHVFESARPSVWFTVKEISPQWAEYDT